MAESPVTIHDGLTMAKQLVMEDGAPWDTQGVILGSAMKRASAYILDLIVIQAIFWIITQGRSITLMCGFGILNSIYWYQIILGWIGFLGLHGAYFQFTGLWLGRSLAQRWFGLAVTNADATPMSAPRWGLRSWKKMRYSLPFIGPLWFGITDFWRIHTDPSHQSLLDRKIGTIIAQANSLPPATRRFLK